MQSSSSTYNRIYESGDYEVRYRVNINGVDYAQTSLWEIRTSRKLFGENNPLFGCTAVGEIDVTITNDGRAIPPKARIRPYIQLYSPTLRLTSEWIQKGEFFIDTREEDDTDDIDLLIFHGYDAMRKAMVKYPSSTLEWSNRSPTTYQVVCEIVCHMFSIENWQASSYIETETRQKLQANPYIVNFPAQYTMSEVLGSIAAMYGGNFCMSDTGKLRLVSLADLPEETYYLVTERGNCITFGGTRILLRSV